jgi:hypothetical protein
MTRRFWRREFFRPLDNKNGFSYPRLNFFTASPLEGEGFVLSSLRYDLRVEDSRTDREGNFLFKI